MRPISTEQSTRLLSTCSSDPSPPVRKFAPGCSPASSSSSYASPRLPPLTSDQFVSPRVSPVLSGRARLDAGVPTPEAGASSAPAGPWSAPLPKRSIVERMVEDAVTINECVSAVDPATASAALQGLVSKVLEYEPPRLVEHTDAPEDSFSAVGSVAHETQMRRAGHEQELDAQSRLVTWSSLLASQRKERE